MRLFANNFRLFSRFAELYRRSTIRPNWKVISKQPSEMKDVTRTLATETTHERVALELEPYYLVEHQEPHEMLRFYENATYLLVGCLGGLGRSVASWMVERGAKRLVFLSRSGLDHPAAAETMSLVQKAGASAQICRADTSIKSDVEAVVAAVGTKFPIRGVLNGAMILKVRAGNISPFLPHMADA